MSKSTNHLYDRKHKNARHFSRFFFKCTEGIDHVSIITHVTKIQFELINDLKKLLILWIINYVEFLVPTFKKRVAMLHKTESLSVV